MQILCQNMYYHLSLLGRLPRIFSNDFHQVNKNYIQHRLHCGIVSYGCSTQKNIDLVQRVQNHATRLIIINFDNIHCREMDLVKSANLYTTRDKKDWFLTVRLFEAIHVIAPTYLSDHIVVNFYVNGFDTRGCEMELLLSYAGYRGLPK